MTIELSQFIEEKAHAVCFYIDGMLDNSIPFDEVLIFIWDTFEEWWHVQSDEHPITHREQVIWHLLHLLQRWPEATLKNNPFLRKQLAEGTTFLKAQGPMLLGCASVRP